MVSLSERTLSPSDQPRGFRMSLRAVCSFWIGVSTPGELKGTVPFTGTSSRTWPRDSGLLVATPTGASPDFVRRRLDHDLVDGVALRNAEIGPTASSGKIADADVDGRSVGVFGRGSRWLTSARGGGERGAPRDGKVCNG